MKRLLVTLVLLPAVTAISSQSFAAALEEIVVTATKRESTEFDTPLSIETITGDSIARQNIGELEDLVTRIPNVNIANGDQITRISIRGLGTGNERSFEQSVAMFIDGVYMPRSRQYRSPFFDMNRVEVLRGPQAVLHGLNATAGTILIHTNTTRAGDEGHVSFGAGYESEYNGTFGEFIAGTSVGDNLGLRLAARYNDTGDGYFTNVITGQKENSSEETLVRLTADWAVSDTWNITAKAYYADANEFGNYGENVLGPDTTFTPPVAAALGLMPDTALDYERLTDNVFTDILGRTPGLDHEITNLSINSDWQIGGGSLTALLSHSESEYEQVYNVDALYSAPGNPSGVEELLGQGLGNLIDESFEQTAIELRYASATDRTLSYVIGIYADKNELVNYLDSMIGILLNGTEGGGLGMRALQDQQQDGDTVSPYASLTWNVSDSFRLTGGIRYSEFGKDYARNSYQCDNMLNELVAPASAFGTVAGPGGWYAFADITGSGLTNCGTLDGLRLSRSSSQLMPELIAQYDFSDTSTMYAKVGKSAKSGGFVFSGTFPDASTIEYDDEEALGYELGLKTRALDGRLELNLALFHNEFTDLQVSSFVTPPGSSPILVVSNAGESTSTGIEAEINFAATDWLTLGTSFGTLDSKYDKYPGGPCNVQELAADPTLTECDKAGQTTGLAPEFSGSVHADLNFPMGESLELFAGALMSFSDDFFTDAALNLSGVQDSYQTWDAQIGIGGADGNWSLSVIGKNLSDERIVGHSLSFAGMIGYLQAPRTVWMQAKFGF